MRIYLQYLLLAYRLSCVYGYSKQLYALTNKTKDYFDLKCVPPPIEVLETLPSDPSYDYASAVKKLKQSHNNMGTFNDERLNLFESTPPSTPENDPASRLQRNLHQFMFGHKVEDRSLIRLANAADYTIKLSDYRPLSDEDTKSKYVHELDIFPSGEVLRAEMFNNKIGVHLPPQELHHPGHCRLRITNDKMQTALNAFAIFLFGSVDDILKLPADYVLRSARTIAMMKIAREKLATTWQVVKGGRKPIEIPHWTLEMYRPLFKYLNGREMARLNLSDTKILTFIGTHAELNRHQVGIVASKYIKMNPHWLEPKYLNLMNNLLCGMPMNLMRKASSNIYLQLTHQVFYHIRACDSLQRRFYLSLMMRTEALGRSYSWNSRDVTRLGLLLAELQGPDFAAINPQAMSGITAQTMLRMPPEVLQYVTETQLRYLPVKPLNILARKLKAYQDKKRTFGYDDTSDAESIRRAVYSRGMLICISSIINVIFVL